ncbi:MAG: MotA/TolQ/ExbB proton channel family protein [Rhodospirillaceae bacterium]|nr:MotA/TolQ/ExbB proton channel family protein [Rhodospirillaceae bacterium]
MAQESGFGINFRMVAVVVSLAAGVLFIVLGAILFAGTDVHVVLFGGTKAGVTLAPESGAWRLPPFPYTMQNLMWIMFFLGCGEIWVRVRQSGRDQAPMRDRLLPEDDETMLRASDLGPIYRRIREASYAEASFLPRLITRTILQFQGSRSIEQANSLLNSTLELCQHEIELRYNMLRYLVWLLPTLGFLGTVVGIASALGEVSGVDFSNQDQMQKMLPSMTSSLGVAFYTTLLALLQSAVLVFALQLAQAREERVLNRAGQYCLDNLINRLYDK